MTKSLGNSLGQSPRAHNPSVDSGHVSEATSTNSSNTPAATTVNLEVSKTSLHKVSEGVSNSCESLESNTSPASHGGYYSSALLEQVSLNLHRIDKDVTRCDRNYYYFSNTLSNPGVGEEHLATLRNIMITYVWEHLDLGYIQGMCDIVAPLLVILEDEAITHACFTRLMLQLSLMNPQGGLMDSYFANMRSLIQILDPEIFEHMLKNGDFTHFYFCYRWFLLDFKREFCYEDVFKVWESIWCAKHVATPQPGLFIALAMMELYRDIVLENGMDFTDIIKFFNEMAEKHKVNEILGLSRDLVYQLQSLISEIS